MNEDSSPINDAVWLAEVLPDCRCGQCDICKMRAELRREQAGLLAIEEAVQRLAAAIAACPSGWTRGDGSGGWIAALLAHQLEVHGWATHWQPVRPRSHIERVANRDGWHCAYCRVELYGDPARPRPSIDHVVPKAQGGTDLLENLVLACLSCNSKKGNRTPAQWIEAEHE